MPQHRSILAAAVFGACALVIAGAASAQDAPANPTTEKVVPASTPPQSASTTQYHAAPTVRLLGIPTEIWAPVDPSYSGTAYRTLGGQAETSADAVAEQGTPWH